MWKWLKSALPVALLLGASGYVQSDERGEKLFAQCRSCHQLGPGARHQYGPVLNGVMDKNAARLKDYDYSNAFKKAAVAGLVWNETTMSEFLAEPMLYLKGTKMAFPGVSNPSERANLIAYLYSFDQDGKSTVTTDASEAEKAEPEIRRLAVDFVVPDHGQLHLGRAALPEEVEAWDIDIRPDGAGLPEGRGDVETGIQIYDAQCGACHGDFGEGINRWPVLAGGHDTLSEERPEKTIGSYWPYLSTVFDYVRRAMPFGNARFLSDDEVYAVTAYLLYLNDQVEEDFVLSSENFTSIRMPNEMNFKSDDRTSEVFRQIGEDQLCMENCLPAPAKVVQRARLLDVTPDE